MKSIFSKIFFFSLAVITFSSCQQVIDLELRDAEVAALVVEAEVVDVEGYSFVRLGETLDFYDPSKEPKISGAIVSVTDQEGNVMPFLEDADEAGLYLPQDPSYKGKVGNIYSLSIENDSRLYTAESELFPTTSIDSLEIRFREEGRFNEEGFYLYFYAIEPQETKDFYFWRTFRNDTLIYEDAGDLLYASDDVVGENIDGLELPYAFRLDDTVRLEQYSITEEVFNFYDDLVDVAFNDGGLFSPPPVNPRTNIKGNNVIGVFSTSSMVSKTVIITKEE